jgi:Phage tail assembly chaperone proteins, E, or 41 or 14
MVNGATTVDDLTAAEVAEAATQSKRIDEYAKSFPIAIPLLTPVRAHGETIDSVSLQLPTGNDLWHTGDPWSEGAGKPANFRVLVTLISRLAGIPESSVKQFAMPDLKTIEAALLPLFAPSAERLKPMLSILRTSSETSEE